MKRLIAIAVVVALVVTLIAVLPVGAKSKPGGVRALYECDIVPTSMGDSDLVKGEAWIRTNGMYKVEIEGVQYDGEPVADDTEYQVELHYGCGCPGAATVVDLGDITISDGEGKVEGTLEFSDDVRCPRIRIFMDGGPAEFTSGFETDTFPAP